MTRQFVVQLENRPGTLAGLARALADRGIDIRQIAGGGMGSVGYAILETDDDAATDQVLRAIGHPFVSGEPLLATIADHPGALASTVDRLAVAGIDVKGILVVGRRHGVVEVALSVDDAARARDLLGSG
jgi:hypothetical protein